MSNWNLFKFFKRRNNFTKRPKISNPILISCNIHSDHGELAIKKRIIDAKSEKNLASLEEIKSTLLQWKEENDKIFTDFKTEQVVFSPKRVKSELSQSLTFDSAATLSVWNNRNRVTAVIYESDSGDNEEKTRNFIEVIETRPTRQDNIRRPERSNSFKALGKVLIKEEDKDNETDFF